MKKTGNEHPVLAGLLAEVGPGHKRAFMRLQREKYVPWIEHGDVVEGMELGARLSGFELCGLGYYLTSLCFSFLI